jgi:hypothetical protein
MKFVERQFMPDVEVQQQTESNGDRETGNIDNSKRLVLTQVAETRLKMITQHKAGFEFDNWLLDPLKFLDKFG